MNDRGGIPYARLLLGVGCLAAGVVAGQMVDQRLMLLAMFPAVALFSGVISSLTALRFPKAEQPPPLSAAEREMLAAVWNGGGLELSEAAERSSLSVAETANVLSALTEIGYLSVRETEGGRIYERAAG